MGAFAFILIGIASAIIGIVMILVSIVILTLVIMRIKKKNKGRIMLIIPTITFLLSFCLFIPLIASFSIYNYSKQSSIEYQGELYTAVSDSSISKVKMLLKNGANPNGDKEGFYPLISACYDGGDYEIAKLLLDYGANVNIQIGTAQLTPLIIACGGTNEMNQIDFKFTKLLVEYGADVSAKDGKGNCPIYYVRQKYEKYKEYGGDYLLSVISLLDSFEER